MTTTFFTLQPLPTLDLQDGMFRAWWFDPFIATISFAVFIGWYWHYERKLGLSSVKAVRLDTFNLHSMPARTTAAYWGSIYLWRMVVPPAAATLPDGIPTNVSDAWYLVAEVMAGLILYDAIFFWIHLAMHEIPALRHLHASHHAGSGGTALHLESRDTLRHSFVDAALQVLVNIAVQRSTPWGAVKSRLARAVHNVLVIWFLTEAHTAAPTPYIWRRWFVGIREHRLHHLAGRQHHGHDHHDSHQSSSGESSGLHSHYGHNHRYQQFFGYLDDMRAFLSKMEHQRRTKRLSSNNSASSIPTMSMLYNMLVLRGESSSGGKALLGKSN